MAKEIYILRGDVCNIWEYYIYGAFTSLDAAAKAAQKLYDNSNKDQRHEMETVSDSSDNLFTGLVISKMAINNLNKNGDEGNGVLINRKTHKVDLNNLKQFLE